ncbi:pyridoxal phosphate-dependent aminotransferase [Kushneria aurantia]|uniref:histidinol-phosphate transaminase n=1 Tax=Kushneria aurantia TaxID=504092 RepID=A0ABV6G224_9GAMM|nr:aminotransferase class I/II-fold pyridoxal phosphate-dependent enzyme [Kushneria aurantia]
MTASHLHRDGPDNPFPGHRALERRLGRTLPHQLGSNEGLDMPHRALAAHLGEPLAALARRYGDAESHELRRLLAARLGVDMAELTVDAGADSLIALALRAFCDSGSTVITSAGTYPTFRYFAEGHGCRLVKIGYRRDNHQLAPDLDALRDAAHQHHARLVYLANPDNPGGHLHDDAAIAQLRQELPADCRLLLDEAYHEFRPDSGDSQQPLPGVLRLRTFSKAYGLAGLRVGYAIAPADDIALLQKVRIHYAVSSVALEAARIVLEHDDEMAEHVRAVIERRERLAQQLGEAGGRVYPSATNFVTVALGSAERAARVQRALLTDGVIVHRPANSELDDVLRITAVEEALVPGRLRALEEALEEDRAGDNTLGER